MPTYLGIVQQAARFSRSIDPRTVTSVTGPGRIGQLADLVAEAWIEIQNRYEAWRFLRAEFPANAVLAEGAAEFTAASLNIENWSEWILGTEEGTVRLTVWPAGEPNRDNERQLVVVEDYPLFRSSYQRGTSITAPTGAPQVVTVDDQDRLVVWPTPDEDYRIAGSYRRSPQVLVDDDDVPIIADQFHNAITWSAVELFHQTQRTATDTYTLAERSAAKRMGALRRRYLPAGKIVYHPLGTGRRSSVRRLSTRAPT